MLIFFFFFFFFLTNRTFIDCVKFKIAVSSANDGTNQPVCYAPEYGFTVGYDTLNTYTLSIWHSEQGFFFSCQISYPKQGILCISSLM